MVELVNDTMGKYVISSILLEVFNNKLAASGIGVERKSRASISEQLKELGNSTFRTVERRVIETEETI